MFKNSWCSTDPCVSTESYRGKTTKSPMPKEALDLLDIDDETKRELTLRDGYEWQDDDDLSSSDDDMSPDEDRITSD